MPGPDAACVLLLAGILGIYAECVWPGRILPAVAGAAALVAGAYSFYCLSPTAAGLTSIAVSVALFAAEALWDCRFVCGILAVATLAAGLRLLINPPHRLALSLAVATAAILGAATVFLAVLSRRARQNKRSDTGPD